MQDKILKNYYKFSRNKESVLGNSAMFANYTVACVSFLRVSQPSLQISTFKYDTYENEKNRHLSYVIAFTCIDWMP